MRRFAPEPEVVDLLASGSDAYENAMIKEDEVTCFTPHVKESDLQIAFKTGKLLQGVLRISK